METRVAVLAVIVREDAAVTALNDLLHQYGSYIIGRMGVPYRREYHQCGAGRPAGCDLCPVGKAGPIARHHRQDGLCT